ncbi:MAG: MetS family NSS transporter small subunit [Longimicrobiales bacterium]
MTIGGWVTMLVSLTVVWGGTFWCFKKVLESPEAEKAPPGFGP